MKRILLILLVAIFSLSFFACKDPSSESSESQSQSQSSGGGVTPTYVVTFTQEGQDDVKISVKEGGSIPSADMPTPVSVKGHTVTWSLTEITSVTSDMTVTANVTPNDYTIFYVVDCGCGIDAPTSQTVTYGKAFDLADFSPNCEHRFKYWSLNKNGIEFNSTTYDFDCDVTVYAVFEETTKPY